MRWQRYYHWSLCLCLFVCLSVRPSVRPSVRLSVSLSVCLSVSCRCCCLFVFCLFLCLRLACFMCRICVCSHLLLFLPLLCNLQCRALSLLRWCVLVSWYVWLLMPAGVFHMYGCFIVETYARVCLFMFTMLNLSVVVCRCECIFVCICEQNTLRVSQHTCQCLTTTSQRPLTYSSRSPPARSAWLGVRWLHHGRALSSPLFQEREEPAGRRQAYHSPEESLLSSQSLSVGHVRTGDRLTSLVHKFQTSEKIHVATHKKSKSGFFRNDKKSRFSLILERRLANTSSRSDYDRRSIQKLNEVIEYQRGEFIVLIKETNNFDDINNFFMNNYWHKIGIFVKLVRRIQIEKRWKPTWGKIKRTTHSAKNRRTWSTAMESVEYLDMCDISLQIQCPRCLTCWMTGILYCTCRTFLRPTERTRNMNWIDLIHYRFHIPDTESPLHGARHGTHHAAHNAAEGQGKEVKINLGPIFKPVRFTESHSSRFDGTKPSAHTMTTSWMKIIHTCTPQMNIKDMKPVGYCNWIGRGPNSPMICRQDTHSQYTSVQYSLFTSGGTNTTRFAQVITDCISSLCAWKESVIWCCTCLPLCCSLTCRIPRAYHLPHSLFLLPQYENTKNTQCITHISSSPSRQAAPSRITLAWKPCRVSETRARHLPQKQREDYADAVKIKDRYDRVPRDCWAHDERVDDVGPIHDEDQGRAPRRKHQHCRCWTFPLLRRVVPAVSQNFQHFSPEQHKRCDVYIRKRDVRHFVLSFGTTMFQGIFVSMTQELTALSPSTMRSRHVSIAPKCFLFSAKLQCRVVRWHDHVTRDFFRDSGVKTLQSGGNPRTDTSHRLWAQTACDCLKDRRLFWRFIYDVQKKVGEENQPSSYHRRSGGIWRNWHSHAAPTTYRILKYQRRPYFQSQMHFDDSVEIIADSGLEDGKWFGFRIRFQNELRSNRVEWATERPSTLLVGELQKMLSSPLVCPESLGETRCNGRAREGSKRTIYSSRTRGKFEVTFIWRSQSFGETQMHCFYLSRETWSGVLCSDLLIRRIWEDSLLAGNKDHLLSQARSDLAKQELPCRVPQ